MNKEKNEPDENAGGNIFVVIFPQSGGYMARLLPIGIDCYSETLDGLHEEVSRVINDYREYLDEVDFDDWFEEGIRIILYGETEIKKGGIYFLGPANGPVQ